uniref:Uncharacterized protein n=1 Tax=Rhipicephalus zambeziensis TaxID=60191 RepID=A0A224YJU4_9ACAR
MCIYAVYIIRTANAVKATWKNRCTEQTRVHTGMLGTIGPRVLILRAAHGDTKWRSALLHTSRLVHREKKKKKKKKKNSRKALSAKTKRSCRYDRAGDKHHTFFQRRHSAQQNCYFSSGRTLHCAAMVCHSVRRPPGSSVYHNVSLLDRVLPLNENLRSPTPPL